MRNHIQDLKSRLDTETNKKPSPEQTAEMYNDSFTEEFVTSWLEAAKSSVSECIATLKNALSYFSKERKRTSKLIVIVHSVLKDLAASK